MKRKVDKTISHDKKEFFMKAFPNLSDMMKGILLMAGGIILLFNTLGIANETLNTIVLLGAIGMIILGLYISGLYQKLYKLLTQEKKKIDTPEE